MKELDTIQGKKKKKLGGACFWLVGTVRSSICFIIYDSVQSFVYKKKKSFGVFWMKRKCRKKECGVSVVEGQVWNNWSV